MNHRVDLTPSTLSTTFAKILFNLILLREQRSYCFFLSISFARSNLFLASRSRFSLDFLRPFVGIHSEQSSINLNRNTCQNKDDCILHRFGLRYLHLFRFIFLLFFLSACVCVLSISTPQRKTN